MTPTWKRITAALIAVAVVAGVAGSAGVSASPAGQDCVDTMGSGAAANMIERLAECGVTPDEVKWTSDGWVYVGSDDGSPAGAKMSAIWGATINPPAEEPLRVARHVSNDPPPHYATAVAGATCTWAASADYDPKHHKDPYGQLLKLMLEACRP